jgi:hypothetical protein
MPGGAPGGQQPQQPQPRQRRAEPEPEEAPQGQNPFGDSPLGKIFEEMLKGTQAGQPGGQSGQRAPIPDPQPRQRRAEPEEAQPERRGRNPYDDLFGEMFETGRKQRDEYQKGVESIFDQFSKGMDR